MNKYFPYIIGGLLAAAIIILFATGNNNKSQRLDERITLRKRDKIPYGTAVAYNNLRHLFPGAAIYSEKREPGYWDSLSKYETKQALIVVTGRFSASESEMKKLITFAENGNDVFISARYISSAADEILGCNSSSYDMSIFSDSDIEDSLVISLNDPPFEKNIEYSYPGKKFETYFDKIDSSTTDILGHDDAGHPDFIHLRAGKGNFYVHLEPLAFSNYFLLHKNNIRYYENALSVIPPDVKKIVWDEYYLYQKSYNEKNNENNNWLSVLFRYPSLKAALLTAIFTLLLYVLLEMRRKQRYIPVVSKPGNDSLDFVKTIGRLYFDKGDHKNLCIKMGTYFLEYVRNRYKLATGMLGEDFVKNLQFKTSCEESEIRGIVSFIKYLDEAPGVSHSQLIDFHKHLEAFYKKA
ncbi:MAG: hypothetical protein JJE22_00490 [Bacteroidia bacterium]|nr:hypothetical protein [Bacteroidia bacterium]